MSVLDKILEYIFLPTCGICGELGEGYLCIQCSKKLEKYMIIKDEVLENSNNILNETELKANNFEQSKLLKNIERMHIFQYKDIIRKTILKYKFNDKSYLYKTFGEFIIKNKKIFDFIKRYDIIIPVPIHKTRMRERGYNQSELMAREIAKKLGLKFYTDVLIKVKNNKPQSTLSKNKRQENIKDVYKLINSEKIYNKKVLIFDDIYTTGATVNSCVRELEKGKIKKIGILTLARD